MKKQRELEKADGGLPVADTETYNKCVSAVINHWSLSKPVDIMVANRMVSTWMKLRYIEGRLNHYGVVFERFDEDGKIVDVKVNEMAYYLKQLESEFRSYYRLLQGGKKEDKPPQDFLSMLEDAGGKNRPKKSSD